MSRAAVLAAIAKWRALHGQPDKHAEAVLQRLSKDRRAARAFAAIDPPPYTAVCLIDDCVKSEMLCRTFASRLEAERDLVKKIELAAAGLRACRAIAEEIARPADGIAATLTSDEYAARLEAALAELHALLESRRKVAEAAPARIGATRKSHDPEAGRRAAVGWIAHSVKHLTARPHCAAVGLLAEVSLGLPADYVSIDQAARAPRCHRGQGRGDRSTEKDSTPIGVVY